MNEFAVENKPPSYRKGLAAGFWRQDVLIEKRDLLQPQLPQVGTTAHNLPLYAFKYIGKDDQYEGVMAQDVLNVMPAAVSVVDDGYYWVNYEMLGIEMRRLN